MDAVRVEGIANEYLSMIQYLESIEVSGCGSDAFERTLSDELLECLAHKSFACARRADCAASACKVLIKRGSELSSACECECARAAHRLLARLTRRPLPSARR